MLEDLVYSPTLEYRTGELYNPRDLYAELFENSQKCDLLLGYFSSTAIRVLSRSFSEFISKGGVLRVLANTVLSEDDMVLFDGTTSIDLLDLNRLDQIYNALNGSQKDFFKCLKFLMNHERIQFQFIKPTEGRGIAHFKSSLFYDGQDTVYSKGSCNFTASGLLYNLEEMVVSRSWDSFSDQLRIEEFRKFFNKTWKGENDTIEIADKIRLKEWVDNKFEEITIDELIRINQKKSNRDILTYEPPSLYQSERIKFPYESGPRGYQIEALNRWLENGKRGLFAMATGTGKTLTALNCLLNVYNNLECYRAIIVVPTSALMLQWKEQVQKFGFQEIYVFNKLTEAQRKTLDLLNVNPEKANFIIILSYATFSKAKFNGRFERLISSSFLIADEAHNASALKSSKVFQKISPMGILGLTATPEKRFQETESFYENVFGSRFPHTFSYSMKEAIDKGILTEYKYFPVSVEMNQDEFESYEKVTASIIQLMTKDKLSKLEKDKLKNLSIFRRSIINSAKQKERAILKILDSILQRQGDLKYTLIYAPVGYDKSDNNDDEISVQEHRINRYTEIISKSFSNATIAQFTGGMKKSTSDKLISSFESGDNQMLISMKCLDEGIDIPIARNAIFISSSGSPREFIQRRGRILRTHQSKQLSFLYDLYVVPPKSAFPSNATKKIAQDEILRISEFASLAINKAEVINLISEIESSYS